MKITRLELSDRSPAFAGQAVIIIDGDELNTITIDLEDGNPLDLADLIIRLVNAHEDVIKTLTAAAHALRSYEYGNSAPDLAHDIAADCDAVSKKMGAAA